MPMKEVFEGDPWRIVIAPPAGTTPDKRQLLAGKAVKLTINGDPCGAPIEVPLTLDGNGEAKHQHRTNPVGDAQKHYTLTASVSLGDLGVQNQGKELEETCKVWPKKLTVLVVHEDGAAKFEGFKFKTKLGPANLGEKKTDAEGKAELNRPAREDDAEITAVAPYMAVDPPAKEPGKERVWKVKGKRAFIPKFLAISKAAVAVPAEGGVGYKVYVNLDPDATGAGKPAKPDTEVWGNELEIEIAVYDNEGYEGRAGDVVFVQAEFGRESKRDDPLPALVDATNIAKEPNAATPPIADAKQTGEVKLADNGSGKFTAKFKVRLGLAGGDTCKVRLSNSKIGFTDTSPTLEFLNWRRVYYELIYADLMKPDLVGPSDDKKDLPAAMTTGIKTILDKVFIEYKLYKSHEAATTVGSKSLLEPAFAKLPGGALPARRQYLYGGSWEAGDGIAFETTVKYCVRVRAWDITVSSSRAAYAPVSLDAVAAAADYTIDRNGYYMTHNPATSAVDGVAPGAASPVKYTGGTLGWKALFPANTGTADAPTAGSAASYMKETALEWETDAAPDTTGAEEGKLVVTDTARTSGNTHDVTFGSGTAILEWETVAAPDTAGAVNGQVTILETTHGKPAVTLTFDKPMIGHIKTDVTDAHRQAITGLVNGIMNDKPELAKNGKLRFKVTAETGNDRRDARFANVKTAVQDAFAASNKSYPSPVLEPGKKTALETFIRGLLNTATAGNTRKLREAENKIKIKVAGKWATGAAAEFETKRFEAVKQAITAAHTAGKKKVPMHPALKDDGTPHDGTIADGTITHNSLYGVNITLPATAGGGAVPYPPLPGDIAGGAMNPGDTVTDPKVPAPTDDKAPVRVSFEILKAGGINGNADKDKQNMLLDMNALAERAKTACHELGHTMGMTITEEMSAPLWQTKKPPGTDKPLHVNSAPTKGSYYCSHKTTSPPVEGGGIRLIHVGMHCASGGTVAGQWAATGASWTSNGRYGTCIMWGAGATQRTVFCPVCEKFVKARNLKDLTTAFDRPTAADN